MSLAQGGLSAGPLLSAGIACVFVGLVGIVLIALGPVARRRPSVVRRRLEMYSLNGSVARREEVHTAFGDSAVARSAVELAGRIAASRGLDERLASRLEASGIPLRPGEWIILQGAAVILLPLVLLVVVGSPLLVVLGLVLGAGAPVFVLRFKGRRRTRKFNEQLPNTLQLLAGSLSAGYSLPQAVDTIAREASEPISGEFNRAIVRARLGVPVEDALEAIAERMKSKDFGWIVMAIRIQREVGGNLAELLHTVAGTLRERERLRRQVLVLSAEGRLSGFVLGGLPVVFTLYLALVRPEYMSVMVTDPIGVMMSVAATIMMIVGGLWMKKVVKVEV